VLAQDFYTHPHSWDLRCTEQRDATYWEDIMDQHGPLIGNDNRPTNHWTRHDSMGESIIDLTLANRAFGKWIILDGSHATASDHEIIEQELEMENYGEAGGTQVVEWNRAAMSQEDLEVAEEWWRKREQEWARVGAESAGDKVESEAELFQEAVKGSPLTAIMILVWSI